MSKVAVMLAEGFEEGEALTIVDILRRANIECHMISTGGERVRGSHDIVVQADAIISDDVKQYDMIVLPGGLPGATNLRDDDRVINLLQEMNRAGKFVCAMCAAPIALGKAGILEDKNFTAYVGYDQKIETTGVFKEDIVVVDGNVVTSRGPATTYAFAYALIDVLGGDSLAVKNRMVYFNAFDAE
ncbi:DJ-1 family glyoxalase III [Paenibacillus sp. FSL R10-2782]|uniref:DJ-1 family protein n=1 Tax=Paenibacillus terrae TaxID=159743 RepID=A0A4U2Q225_9BACL|nr:DJ-1 family glyoxalase III [Paenibacillus terrae]TKH46213.1 DJ-1 family protein [Paenibacillus terrae]